MQFIAVFSGASWPNQCFISQSFCCYCFRYVRVCVTMISVISLGMYCASSVASASISNCLFLRISCQSFLLNMWTNRNYDCIWMHYNLIRTQFDILNFLFEIMENRTDNCKVKSNYRMCSDYFREQITLFVASCFLSISREKRPTKYVVNTQLQLRRFSCVVVVAVCVRATFVSFACVYLRAIACIHISNFYSPLVKHMPCRAIMWHTKSYAIEHKCVCVCKRDRVDARANRKSEKENMNFRNSFQCETACTCDGWMD